MALLVAEQELFHACQVLFGSHLNISREFLEYLQRPGIKSAYRKRAFETHPDLAVSRGDLVDQPDSDLFKTVHQAYENLTKYLVARENGFRFTTFKPVQNRAAYATGAWRRQKPAYNAGQQRPAPRENKRYAGWSTKDANWSADTLYNGPLPERRLLLGHFLYYAGIISWRTVVKALIWQRSNRPRLGEIGRRFGWLTDEEILEIIRISQGRRPFGLSAVELGKLTEPQLKLIVFQQKCLQKRFGEFFVEHEMLSLEALDDLVARFEAHNSVFPPPAGKSKFSR